MRSQFATRKSPAGISGARVALAGYQCSPGAVESVAWFSRGRKPALFGTRYVIEAFCGELTTPFAPGSVCFSSHSRAPGRWVGGAVWTYSRLWWRKQALYSARCISSSVALSMALVESSRIRMRGSFRNARARAMRCRWLTNQPRCFSGLACNLRRGSRNRVHGHSHVLERHHTEDRLGIVGTEDDLHHGLLPHQCDASKTVLVFHWLAVRQFVHGLGFRPDPCGAQAVGRTETIHRPRVDQKIRLVWRSAAGKIAHLRGNVGQTHAKGIRGSPFAVNRRLVPAPVSRCSGWGAVIWELGAILDTAELADVRVCSVLQWQGEPMNWV